MISVWVVLCVCLGFLVFVWIVRFFLDGEWVLLVMRCGVMWLVGDRMLVFWYCMRFCCCIVINVKYILVSWLICLEGGYWVCWWVRKGYYWIKGFCFLWISLIMKGLFLLLVLMLRIVFVVFMYGFCLLYWIGGVVCLSYKVLSDLFFFIIIRIF